jgi:hypothetical protein
MPRSTGKPQPNPEEQEQKQDQEQEIAQGATIWGDTDRKAVEE